jgi:Ca-activated chloride channel homolog
VENREDAGNPTRIFTGITIENGKTVEKTAEFSGGTLKVKAVRNGKPLSAYCTVFETGEGKGKKEVAGSHTGEDGFEFQLLPGTYDVEVENQEDAGRTRVSFKATTVEAGKTVEKTAEFSGGTLKVKAIRNGNPFSAYCTGFEPGEGGKKEVTGSHTGEDGVEFQLLPGTYDIEVENQEDATRPRQSIKGIKIEAGKTVERTAEFTGGTLTVRAVRNGVPFSVYCTVFTGGEGSGKKEVTGGHTGEDGVEFQLPPGTYSLVAEDQDARVKKEMKDVKLEAGKTRLVEIKF